MFHFIKHGLLVVVAVALCFSTLFAKSHAINKDNTEKTVFFGYPFAFVRQFPETASYIPYYDFSWQISDLRKTKLIPTRLVLSFGVVFIALEGLVFFLEILKGNISWVRIKKAFFFPQKIFRSFFTKLRRKPNKPSL